MFQMKRMRKFSYQEYNLNRFLLLYFYSDWILSRKRHNLVCRETSKLKNTSQEHFFGIKRRIYEVLNSLVKLCSSSLASTSSKRCMDRLIPGHNSWINKSAKMFNPRLLFYSYVITYHVRHMYFYPLKMSISISSTLFSSRNHPCFWQVSTYQFNHKA